MLEKSYFQEDRWDKRFSFSPLSNFLIEGVLESNKPSSFLGSCDECHAKLGNKTSLKCHKNYIETL